MTRRPTTPMTREDRLRLIRAPISTGILATTVTGGMGSGGVTLEDMADRPHVPVLGKLGTRVGRQASPTKAW